MRLGDPPGPGRRPGPSGVGARTLELGQRVPRLIPPGRTPGVGRPHAPGAPPDLGPGSPRVNRSRFAFSMASPGGGPSPARIASRGGRRTPGGPQALGRALVAAASGDYAPPAALITALLLRPRPDRPGGPLACRCATSGPETSAGSLALNQLDSIKTAGLGGTRAYRASRATRTGSGRGAGPTYSARGRINRLSAYCSRMWAHHPATRPVANTEVQRSSGRPREA
jgi:hypothetical protein